MSGKRLHDLVDIEHVPLRFEGADCILIIFTL